MNSALSRHVSSIFGKQIRFHAFTFPGVIKRVSAPVIAVVVPSSECYFPRSSYNLSCFWR